MDKNKTVFTSWALLTLAFILFVFPSCRTTGKEGKSGFCFEISFPESLDNQPLDGRILLMISSDESREPRFQITSRWPDAQLIFGIDIEELKPGEKAVIDASAFGYPLQSLADMLGLMR